MLVLGEVAYFPADEYDVVIIRVESEDLHTLYDLLGQLPNVETHSEYQPHVTLAYVKTWLDGVLVVMCVECFAITLVPSPQSETTITLKHQPTCHLSDRAAGWVM